VLADFQDQRRFLVIAALLAGACALAMGVVRTVATASIEAGAAVGRPLAGAPSQPR
jgi:hypothetical protein